MPCTHPFPVSSLEGMQAFLDKLEADFAAVGVTTECGHTLGEVAADYGERFARLTNGDPKIAHQLLGRLYQANAIHAAALHATRTELLRLEAQRVQPARPGQLFDLNKKRRK